MEKVCIVGYLEDAFDATTFVNIGVARDREQAKNFVKELKKKYVTDFEIREFKVGNLVDWEGDLDYEFEELFEVIDFDDEEE